jgi:hypothetical protein
MSTRAQRIGALAVVVLGALATGVHAQVFYSYPGARPVTDTSPSLGLVAGFGEDLVRLGGFGRFNVSPSVDLGLEAMFDNLDNDGAGEDDTGFFGAGGDGKFLLVPADEDMPLDIAAQAGVGFLSRSGYFLLHVPFGGIASHDFLMSDGRRITPYGGVYFVFDYASFDAPAGADDSDTDFDVEMRVGASAEIVKRGSLFAALHAGNGTMFFLGFNAGL